MTLKSLKSWREGILNDFLGKTTYATTNDEPDTPNVKKMMSFRNAWLH